MKRPKRSIGLGIVVAAAAAVTAITGVGVVRTEFGCFPPWNEIQLIAQFKDDPLFTIGPGGGRLINERVFPGACSTHSMADDFGGSTTYVTRKYRTSAALTYGQLLQRFGQPAAAAGWRIDEEDTGLLDPDSGHAVEVTYCRYIGDRLLQASVISSDALKTTPYDDPTVGVSVHISAPWPPPVLTDCAK